MKKKLLSKCFITQTKNNIFVLFMDHKKEKVLFERSSGKLGFTGAGKRTRLAAEMLGKELGQKIKLLNYQYVDLYLRGGISPLTRGVVSGLIKAELTINELTFLRSIAHNGVRAKKVRRV